MIHKFKILHIFCGIGGGAYGFQMAQHEYKGIIGSFETICGIDCDIEACEDFERITGSRAVCMDLFSREQYIQFHGQEPPIGWQEVTPEDIRRACKGVRPNVVFLSPPCKGLSGLLPEETAQSPKYQALNGLTVRGIQLVCEAFKDDLPELLLFENVPRIKTRGARLLKQIRTTLTKNGYVINPTKQDIHNCGEVGMLAQNRNRYVLIARNPKKVPGFIYEPEKKGVKALREVLEDLPLPGDPSMGPMHRLPRLQWKTWVRLALIPAGGDWRDIQNIDLEKYRIEHVTRNDCFGVMDWQEPSVTVTGNMKVGGSSKSAIADPRLKPRESRYNTAYFVVKMDETGPCVTGTKFGSGAPAIADVRTNFKDGAHHALYRVSKWDEAGYTVTGASMPSNGAICIDDPRLGCTQRAGTMGVMKWDEPAKTVTSADVYSGSSAIADQRIPADNENGSWVIISTDGTWHRPLTTLELAVIQSLPTHINGQPLVLAGKSDKRWRERIGNMVPPDAAKEMGNTILRTLLANLKDEIVLGWTPIWVDRKVSF